MGREEFFKWRQPVHHQLMSQQGPHFSLLKPMIKAHSSGVSSGISDVVIASVYSEKTRLKKSMMMLLLLMMIIVIKSQEMMVFNGCRKLTSAMKPRPEK